MAATDFLFTHIFVFQVCYIFVLFFFFSHERLSECFQKGLRVAAAWALLQVASVVDEHKPIK